MKRISPAGRPLAAAAAAVVLVAFLSACSSPEPTDSASACRDFEQAFTATAAGHMSNDEWIRHFTAERAVAAGRVGQAFRLDHIDAVLIAQECRMIGVSMDLSRK